MSARTAKFPGTCKSCSGRFAAGETIVGEPGQGWSHVSCPQVAAPVVAESNPDLDPAVTWLRAEIEAGTMTDDLLTKFLQQYDAKGWLSKKQIALIVKKMQRAGLPGPDKVPAARYAIERGGTTLLVRVWRGRRGYVKCYDDDTGVELDSVATLLATILKDGPAVCARRYGQLRQRCSRCRHKLKTRLSVELSMGPECLKHFYGTETCKALRATAREVVRARGEDPDEAVYSSPDDFEDLVQPDLEFEVSG